MSKNNKPRRGSRAYSPRKRARSETPHVSSWPAGGNGEPQLQGFAGYKVGMTHIMAVDYRRTSTTAGQEVRMPVLYYVDPKILADPDNKDTQEITLSYTFYPVEQGQKAG